MGSIRDWRERYTRLGGAFEEGERVYLHGLLSVDRVGALFIETYEYSGERADIFFIDEIEDDVFEAIGKYIGVVLPYGVTIIAVLYPTSQRGVNMYTAMIDPNYPILPIMNPNDGELKNLNDWESVLIEGRLTKVEEVRRDGDSFKSITVMSEKDSSVYSVDYRFSEMRYFQSDYSGRRVESPKKGDLIIVSAVFSPQDGRFNGDFKLPVFIGDIDYKDEDYQSFFESEVKDVEALLKFANYSEARKLISRLRKKSLKERDYLKLLQLFELFPEEQRPILIGALGADKRLKRLNELIGIDLESLSPEDATKHLLEVIANEEHEQFIYELVLSGLVMPDYLIKSLLPLAQHRALKFSEGIHEFVRDDINILNASYSILVYSVRIIALDNSVSATGFLINVLENILGSVEYIGGANNNKEGQEVSLYKHLLMTLIGFLEERIGRSRDGYGHVLIDTRRIKNGIDKLSSLSQFKLQEELLRRIIL